ncbi:unnamed protein product [Dovyalis caffra]|uniref:Uncharacterized protein n=1 Tax=Dovyalis caffra TaxID=77055 RepID=A0AAV1SNT3_9ROSI|nr:unnamed protein product [Dovyalis caffra]
MCYDSGETIECRGRCRVVLVEMTIVVVVIGGWQLRDKLRSCKVEFMGCEIVNLGKRLRAIKEMDAIGGKAASGGRFCLVKQAEIIDLGKTSCLDFAGVGWYRWRS